MRKENNILDRPEMKANPFTAPEGYFEDLGERMVAAALPEEPKAAPARRLAPYFAYVASLVFLAVIGTFLLRTFTPGYDSTDEALAYNDAVEYLIFTGTSLEEISSTME